MKNIRTATNVDLQTLYDDGAFTYVGLLDEAKEYDSLEKFLFEECGLKRPEEVVMYKASGDLINKEFNLKGKNRFPKDLNIVMLPSWNFDRNDFRRLAIIKLQIGARRFDDLIENSK